MTYLKAEIPLMTSAMPFADKRAAIRYGAEVALDSHSEILVVVDNDIVIPGDALESLVAAFRTSASGAACATKAPLTGFWSTPFQLLYSYAVQQSFCHDLFPKRGTGSFYAVDPAIAHSVMSYSEIGDTAMLARIGATLSSVVVQSPYADNIDAEIDRRARHWLASSRDGYFRFHADPNFADDAMTIKIPNSVDRPRFRNSIRLWRRVHEEAAVKAASRK
ncbi:hypothetical protein LIX60_30820 [Streptomyces sp. S07_1.15]|uniref:hypothetical protein n=1 Tax=Streptomyces sp. S07_1.15 TaxID=2873925 RepID=UPI001D15A2D2|nr:hypothetical protein [Streptomyces sp. S07_1.15]MCC3655776.1 hypothetical protein [Streptomyces sp. S07_1.15]